MGAYTTERDALVEEELQALLRRFVVETSDRNLDHLGLIILRTQPSTVTHDDQVRKETAGYITRTRGREA